MATTTSAKAARKAARESALAANADLARRTKLNVEDLTKFFASMSRADGVDDWLNEKVAALKEQAGRRRDVERRHAGGALAAMRGRGELVRDIARLARISDKQVRDLIRLVESEAVAEADAAEVADHGLGPVAAVGPRGIGDAHAESASEEGVNLAAVGQ